MDNQTRIGLGGTALGILAGLGQPLLGWWVSGPIMGICAAAAAWGFWPLITHRVYSLGRATPARISLLTLLSEAAAKGWVFNRDTLQTFMQALRQAASEGSVIIWGVLKNGRDLISAPSLHVADKIPASYFKEHWIDAHQGWAHNENRYVSTSVPSGRNEPNLYSNLELEKESALAWLDSIKR
jgi:hypothetical protein